MFIFGLLFVAAAFVFGVDLIDKNDFSTPTAHVFGASLGVHGGAAMFLVGAGAGAVALFGVMLAIAGLRYRSAKAVARRRERREARQLADDRESLAAENARLRDQLEADRDIPAGRNVPAGRPVPAGRAVPAPVAATDAAPDATVAPDPVATPPAGFSEPQSTSTDTEAAPARPRHFLRQ